MTDREAQLSVLGVNVGPANFLVLSGQNLGFSNPAPFPTISGFGVFTPISLNSHTTRAKNANVERDNKRD